MRRVKLVLAAVATMATLLMVVAAPAVAERSVCIDVFDGSRCIDLGCEFVGFGEGAAFFLCEVDPAFL